MPSNYKPRPATNYFVDSPSDAKRKVGKLTFSITLSQIVLSWLVVIALMYGVFTLGVRVGESNGITLALEEHSVSAIKLPITLADNAIDEPPLIKPPLEAKASEPEPIDFSKVGSGGSALALTGKDKDPLNLKKKLDVATPRSLSDNSEARAMLAKPAPTKKLTSPKDPAPKTWFVQVASTEARRDALEIAEAMRQKGLPTKVREATVNNTVYFRVLVGPYNSKETAENVTKSVTPIATKSSKPFIKND